MKTDEDFMRIAIEEAKEAEKTGNPPIGSVIVKDGKVFTAAQSAVWRKKDPSAHSEIECIKAACQKLNDIYLSGFTLYSTHESCSMCLGCASWAGVSELVFGAYKEDIPGNQYEVTDYHAEHHAQQLSPLTGNPIIVRGGVLRDECKDLMKNYKDWKRE